MAGNVPNLQARPAMSGPVEGGAANVTLGVEQGFEHKYRVNPTSDKFATLPLRRGTWRADPADRAAGTVHQDVRMQSHPNVAAVQDALESADR